MLKALKNGSKNTTLILRMNCKSMHCIGQPKMVNQILTNIYKSYEILANSIDLDEISKFQLHQVTNKF